MTTLRAASVLLISSISAIAQIDDGPHLFHRPDGSVEAVWIEKSVVKKQSFKKDAPVVLPRFAHLIGPELRLAEHKPETATYPMPEKMLVISDVEGRYDEIMRFLKANGVIDAKGQWAYGKGHLVTVGDMVDRGEQVTEVLWLMYRLSAEARKAGGRVHFVLGNHEVMIMGGDIRYIAPKYAAVVTLLKTPYPDLVGKDSEIGRWLRARNALVRVGDYLFVHAGISPQLDLAKGSFETLNGQIRSVTGIPLQQVATVADLPSRIMGWGRQGVLWYRGYFPRYAADFGPRPESAQIDAILKMFGAKTMVIGHTKVTYPTFIYDRRRVLAIDTPWTDLPNVRGLLVEGDKAFFVDVNGKRTPSS